MADIKTKATTINPVDFLNKITPDQKREDGFKLLELFKKITGKKAVMWGPSMIGFDKYHYKSDRSSQEGDWPMAAFSPRKQNLTLYVMTGFSDLTGLLAKLGKHKTSVGCLYINKLDDVDMNVLEEIVRKSYQEMRAKYKL